MSYPGWHVTHFFHTITLFFHIHNYFKHIHNMCIYIYIYIYPPNRGGTTRRGSYFFSDIISLSVRIARRQLEPRYLSLGT